MPSTVTFTGQLGPGLTITAKVFSNVTDVDFQIDRGVLQITHGIPQQITHLELSNTATVTDTISSGNHTFTIST